MCRLDVNARMRVGARLVVLDSRSLKANSQGLQFALDHIVCKLGPQVIVDDCPRRHGPAVIHLPDQRAGTVFLTRALPLALPESVRASQTLGLHELRAINVLLKGLERVLHVFDKVQGDASLVAIGLVMEVDGGGLRVAIGVGGAVREVRFDRLDVREAFHAEFGDEAAGEPVEVLVFFLGTVPY